MSDLIHKLIDLHKQATTEHSHYYTANLLKQAINEILRLQHYEWMYNQLSK